MCRNAAQIFAVKIKINEMKIEVIQALRTNK